MKKQQENARRAKAKAHGQRVYISGLQGQHSLEKGVAYHYRGHYIYAYPAGNPIEPVPFSTKRGINIVGTAQYLAPHHDPNAPDLVPEASIAALHKTWHHLYSAQKEHGDEKRREVAQAVAEEQVAEEDDAAGVVEMPVIVRSGSHTLSSLPGESSMSYSTPLVPTQVSLRMGSRVNSHTELSSLTVLDARRRPGKSASSSHSVILQSRPSSRAGLPSLAAASKGHISRFSGRSVTPKPHRSLSRPSSSTSLAVHDTQAGSASSSSATIPNLRHSSSYPDPHVSSSSLTTLGREHAPAHLQAPQPNSGMAPTMPTMPTISAYSPSNCYGEIIYTPHDRARFLSDSAPGSRLASVTNTPYASRPVSPSHQHAHAPSALRQVASTTHIAQLLAEDRMPRAFSPLSDVVEGKPTFSATTISRGVQDLPTNSFPEDLSAIGAFSETSSPPHSRNKPIGTGRPRRASMALNQHYNAAKEGNRAVTGARLPKCALHGEECDGVSVAETWKTQHANETTGFKELYPVVEGAGDRIMVDWHQLLREEQVALWG